MGKLTFQPKNVVIEIDRTRIVVHINEVGGAIPVTEPFRISLYLDKKYQPKLTIFPKSLWNTWLDFILFKRKAFIPKIIRKQFSFGGSENLLKRLASNTRFVENMENERIYIRTGGTPTDRIILTPEYGIDNLNQFDKFITILKLIEKALKASLYPRAF